MNRYTLVLEGVSGPACQNQIETLFEKQYPDCTLFWEDEEELVIETDDLSITQEEAQKLVEAAQCQLKEFSQADASKPAQEDKAPDNQKKPFFKRYGEAILLAAATVIAVFVFSGMLSHENSQEPDPLLSERVTLEYGQALETIKEIVADVPVRLDDSNVKYSTRLQVPEIGTWPIDVYSIRQGNQLMGTIQLRVEDTTPPVFVKSPSTIQVDEGAKIDVNSWFEADDLTSVELSLDLSDVDLNKPGRYSASVIAQDAAGNSTSQSVDIQVLEPEGLIAVDENRQTMKNGILLVNRDFELDDDYAPGEDLTAREQLEKLIQAMKKAGLDVSETYDGYRSWDAQLALYEKAVEELGQKQADKEVEQPGQSEHQTGLAFDLFHADGSSLIGSEEAKWLEEHCAEYGFIIRYPQGKEEITGWSYQPGHLRYIGSKASEIMESGQSLEEYLGLLDEETES